MIPVSSLFDNNGAFDIIESNAIFDFFSSHSQ